MRGGRRQRGAEVSSSFKRGRPPTIISLIGLSWGRGKSQEAVVYGQSGRGPFAALAAASGARVTTAGRMSCQKGRCLTKMARPSLTAGRVKGPVSCALGGGAAIADCNASLSSGQIAATIRSRKRGILRAASEISGRSLVPCRGPSAVVKDGRDGRGPFVCGAPAREGLKRRHKVAVIYGSPRNAMPTVSGPTRRVVKGSPI